MRRSRLKKGKVLYIRNPFYVKPSRMTRAGRTSLKELTREYVDTTRVGLMRSGFAPNEKFFAVEAAFKDFAKQADKSFYVQLKRKHAKK